MKKNIYLILGIVIVIAGIYFYTQQTNPNPSPASTSSAQLETFSVEQKITYSGIKPDETLQNVTIRNSQTALDTLQSTKTIETKDSSFGKFVESIDGVKGDDKNFWAFYVNGAQSQVGASSYQLKPNDKVEWKYEKIQ